MQGATMSHVQPCTSLAGLRAGLCTSRRPFTSRPDRLVSCSHSKTAGGTGQQQSRAADVAFSTNATAERHRDQGGAAMPAQSQIPVERSLLASAALGCAAAVAALPLLSLPAAALHVEPQNALSLPTWAIHVSSVLEWVAAMALVWRYADVSGEPRWKGLTWGMMPLLAGAMCACTHHFFYNDPQLDTLVALQAFFTVLGNTTCWYAAYRIYAASKAAKADA